MTIKHFFGNRFETKKAANIVRWLILGYALITVAFLLLEWGVNNQAMEFIYRTDKSNKLTFLVLMYAPVFIAFTLFNKKLASKIWYLLLVSFILKLGWYFERFVILTTSIHRDYQYEEMETNVMEMAFYGAGIIVFQGVFIALLILGLLEIIKKKQLQ